MTESRMRRIKTRLLWCFPLGLLVGVVVLWWQVHVLPQHMKQAVQQLVDAGHADTLSREQAVVRWGERIAPLLLQAMEKGPHDQRYRLGQALSKLGASVWPWSKKGLRHEDWRVREVVMIHLHRVPVPSEEKLPYLSDGLRDDSPYVRYAAVEALAQLGVKSSKILPDLYRVLREGNTPLSHDRNGHPHDHSSHRDPSASDQDHKVHPWKVGQAEPTEHRKGQGDTDAVSPTSLPVRPSSLPVSATDPSDPKNDRKHRRLQRSGLEQNKLQISRIIAGRLCHTPDDVDRETRLAIVRNLRKMDMRADRVVEQLLIALSDRDRWVRIAAHQELVHMRKAAVPHVLQYLQQPQATRAYEATRVLADMGKEAWPVLLSLVVDAESLVWQHAASALFRPQVLTPSLADVLCRHWEHTPSVRHRELARILAHVGARSLPCFVQKLHHPDVSVRVAAVYGVGLLPQYHPQLLTPSHPTLGLQWPQTPLQSKHHSATTKPTTGFLGVTGVLWKKLLHDPHRRVRHEMLWAIGQWQHRMQFLLPELLLYRQICLWWLPTSADWECVELLARAWMRVAPQHRDVVQYVSRALLQGHPSLQQRVLLALMQAQHIPQPLFPVVLQSLRSPHRSLRKLVEAVLVQHQDGLVSHANVLYSMISQSSAQTRQHIWSIVARIRTPNLWGHPLQRILLERAKQATVGELSVILSAMSQVFADENGWIQKIALSYLEHKDVAVKKEVLRWLARSRRPAQAWVPRVMRGLKHSDWRVRRQSLRTLGAWGKHAHTAANAVRDMIRDPSFEVSLAAQKALLHIRNQHATSPSFLKP